MDNGQKPPRTPKGTWPKGVSGNNKGRPKADKADGSRIDGWGSTLTGIGNVLYDKRQSHTFAPIDLSYEQCTQIFEGDDLGKRAAAGPVDDAFRQGYEISIADEGQYEDLKEDIENRLRELDVNKVIKTALTQKRALGGAAILLGVRDNKSMDRPLDRKKASDIEFLTNLEPMDLFPHTYYDDPLAPKFGEVRLWELRTYTGVPYSSGQSPMVGSKKKEAFKPIVIHESRLIIFNTDKISKYSVAQNPAGPFWGLSIYTQIFEILRDFNISWAAAGLIITDFSQAVFSIENLNGLVGRNEEQLLDKMRAMNLGRSVARAVLIDTKEKFERESVNVAGLSDLLNQLSRRFSAAIDTPLSVLMSSGSKSDGSEMGDELRYYYDRLSSSQRDEIGPVIRLIAEIIMRGLRQRKIPKKWEVKWHPLWQLTDEQKANARLAQARVDAIYVKHGILDTDTVAQQRFGGEYSFDTALSPSYKSPGFMALPPMGVLVGGMDPKTGLPPGVQPPKPTGTGGGGGAGETGAHGVSSYARRNPRQTSLAGSDQTAGGDTTGKADDMGYIERSGDKWLVMSEEGEVSGEFETKEEALKRLRETEPPDAEEDLLEGEGEGLEEPESEHCNGEHEETGDPMCDHCKGCMKCAEGAM
jgi:phage-related protein (TIGR01555 family)